MTDIKSGEYVNIGEQLTYVEQYLGDAESTYTENGIIYAAIPGKVDIKEDERIIKVDGKPQNQRSLPKKGDLVTGQIYMIRKNSVGVHIHTINKKLAVDLGLIGNIHVANVSKGYVDKLDNVFQKTDLIRARVVYKSGKEFRIATNSPELGVIKSSCKYCGKDMVRKGRDQVICNFCNHYERKVLANDYNEVELILEF